MITRIYGKMLYFLYVNFRVIAIKASAIPLCWRSWLQPGLHQRDQTTGDETEGTPGCLQEGDDGEVGCSGPCVKEPPPGPLGGDHRTGPWQRTGAVGVNHAHTLRTTYHTADKTIEYICVRRRQNIDR